MFTKIPSFGFLVPSIEPSELIFRIMMGSLSLKNYNVNIFWEKHGKSPIPI